MFKAVLIEKDDAGYRAGIETLTLDGLNPGEVVIKTAYSSVNYKDALAGTGQGKILRRFPHRARRRPRSGAGWRWVCCHRHGRGPGETGSAVTDGGCRRPDRRR